MPRRAFFVALAASLMLAGAPHDPGRGQDPDFDPTKPQIERDEPPVVILRALDKVTARISELRVPVGETAKFGTLEITASYCRSRPPIEPPETYAHLTIVEQATRSGAISEVFQGWMLASSPALNPLEHPVYDVWVIACKTTSGEAFTGSDHQSA